MRLSFALLSLSLSLPLGAQQPAPAMPPSQPFPPMHGQVVTSGSGQVKVAPDRATLMIGVESRAKTAAGAGAANATLQTAVLASLRKLGLTSEQLSTVGYDLQAEQTYEQNKGPQIIGYVARNTVRADLRDIKQVGPAIDAALGAGATNINSVQFAASNIDDARRSAYGKAVAQACADGQALAMAAGRFLGQVVELSTLSESPRPMFATMQVQRGMSKSAAPTPIEAGDIDVNVTVFARWSLAPVGVTAQNAEVQRCAAK